MNVPVHNRPTASATAWPYREKRNTLAALALVVCLGGSGAGTADAQPATPPRGARERFDVDVFARVPNPPGLPEGIAVAQDGTVYVATNPGGNAPDGPQFGSPSQVFAYSPAGRLERSYAIEGQNLASTERSAYGLQALALDREGLLYLVDKAPARIVRLDPRTGRQTDYATFPDVRPCGSSSSRQCSATRRDLRALPNYLAFAPDGSLYVSDFQQALVWRVPRGGGVARVAFTDRRLDSGQGPNGVGVLRGGHTLVLAQTVNPSGVGTPEAGRLYTLRIRQNGQLDQLRKLYESRPGDGPDGFAVAASGNLYLTLAQANQVAVISPEGEEVARVGAKTGGLNGTVVPFDGPASAAFAGRRLLVTNQAVSTRKPNAFAVLDVLAEEDGLTLFRPRTRPRRER